MKAHIEIAGTERVENYDIEVAQLLTAIANYMIGKDDDPAEWVDSCFVSDESLLGDFLYRGADLDLLATDLNLFVLYRSDLVYEIAAQMKQMKSIQ